MRSKLWYKRINFCIDRTYAKQALTACSRLAACQYGLQPYVLSAQFCLSPLWQPGAGAGLAGSTAIKPGLLLTHRLLLLSHPVGSASHRVVKAWLCRAIFAGYPMSRLTLICLSVVTLVLLILAYLLLLPVPINPVAWQATPFVGYSPPHARNEKLAKLQHISLGMETGPEHVLTGPDGLLYVALLSGAILQMRPDGSQQHVYVHTKGRVLGMAFDASGNLIAADAMRGLLLIRPDKQVQVLAQEFQGQPLRYPNAVVVAKDGQIYFTDASQRFAPKDYDGTFHASVLDILEHSATGRVFRFDVQTRQLELVAQGLCFANGLALSADERSLYVAETGEYRVWKIARKAQALNLRKKTDPGLARLVLRDLPGYPDNLMRGRDGRIWLGLAKPRGALIDQMATQPWLRSLTLRLPKFLWPVPPAYGHVLAFDETGKILLDLQDPGGKYPETTGVTETSERLYIQSLHANSLAWIANPFNPMSSMKTTP